MPKDRRSSSFDRCRASPYSLCYKNYDNRSPKSPSLPIGNDKEWDEVRCPICMEHPHNAVLLLCSSREKGCRPYMCDTSSRHSNCLDQFRKSAANAGASEEVSEGEQTKLVCPLCRGQINGWIVVEPARHFMNSKMRSCSMGTCDFAGNYSLLRKHARCEHPYVRPTEVDVERELEWKSLEEEMEQQDMLSMQFEFDNDDDDIEDELMDGVYELASPIWDYDLDFQNFLSTFESEFESVFPELDWGSGDSSGFLDDWENILGLSASRGLESREPGRSRTSSQTPNRLLARPRENGPTSRSSRSGQRASGQHQQSHRRHPSLHNRQEQITTLVDFHELRSNLP